MNFRQRVFNNSSVVYFLVTGPLHFVYYYPWEFLVCALRLLSFYLYSAYLQLLAVFRCHKWTVFKCLSLEWLLNVNFTSTWILQYSLEFDTYRVCMNVCVMILLLAISFLVIFPSKCLLLSDKLCWKPSINNVFRKVTVTFFLSNISCFYENISKTRGIQCCKN